MNLCVLRRRGVETTARWDEEDPQHAIAAAMASGYECVAEPEGHAIATMASWYE